MLQIIAKSKLDLCFVVLLATYLKQLVERRLKEITEKIEEYKARKEEKLKKKEMKKKEWKERNRMIVDDYWGMFRWLTQYIEENKFEWEKRRITLEKEN